MPEPAAKPELPPGFASFAAPPAPVVWWSAGEVATQKCDESEVVLQRWTGSGWEADSELQQVLAGFVERNESRLAGMTTCIDWIEGDSRDAYWVSFKSVAGERVLRHSTTELYSKGKRVKGLASRDMRVLPHRMPTGTIVTVILAGLERGGKLPGPKLEHYHLDVFRGKKRVAAMYRPHFDVQCTDRKSGSRLVGVSSMAMTKDGSLWVLGYDCQVQERRLVLETFKPKGGWGKIVTIPEQPLGPGGVLAVGDDIWVYNRASEQEGAKPLLARRSGKRWHKETLPAEGFVRDLVSTKSGELWLLMEEGGVFSRAEGAEQWQSHAGPKEVRALRGRETSSGSEIWLIGAEIWLKGLGATEK